MKNLLTTIIFFCFANLVFTQNAVSNVETALFNLPDVTFKKIDTPEGFEAAYELKVRQPIDHKHPEKGFFYQKVFLNHAGFDRPTVIVTEGYQRPTNRVYELTPLLKANQLDVEHRFFGDSKPEPLDYQYLNLEQATADLHHINQIFREIYKGKWVSTGISKGGQTTIYYRYFYPADVDVAMPYVAPLNQSLEEQRIYAFLDTVGTPECRAKIKSVQTRLLKNREEVLTKLKWFAKGAGQKFTYLSFEQAFEYSVLEYQFSFWQMGHDCSKIPGHDVPLDSTISHFLSVSDLGFFSDDQIANYSSHYYQAGDEMGYYGYRTEDFKGLLKALPANSHPSAVFMPNKLPTHFDGELPKKVANWLDNWGNNFIYINGDSDTWSATAVRPSGKTNAVFFFMPKTSHSGARIKNMTKAEKEKLVTTLEQWLGMEIEN
ncbi:MAG: hypothetical protein K9J37_09345 [Saprospiraceae bacterium]|nr:hypothetical protein [Saprospiraceae bacterium]MCF8250108.1 hypothetical protein [Saprospiraceae bacterium]MCF8279372.1 aminopeptidase [Bacteroidales bacterium]MCF8311162.1 hypothetical protein [Saprospiraceae bacterium]MCF8440457.1 hypothetical protein [Saprospiraceae bacterium]